MFNKLTNKKKLMFKKQSLGPIYSLLQDETKP